MTMKDTEKKKEIKGTANKGEWSEMYAFFKLLGEGKVYAGDKDLNKIETLFYPILSIIREEQSVKYHYINNQKDRNIVIHNSEGKELLCVESSVFLAEAEYLLNSIRGHSGSFKLERTLKFMHRIYCKSIKAKAADKTDIHIVIHDSKTKMCPDLGFSIKSELGGDSTLLNAGITTNFIFLVKGPQLTNGDVLRINSIKTRSKVIDRIKAIQKNGNSLEYNSMENRTFYNNLLLMDQDIERILAHMLLYQIKYSASDIKSLTDYLKEENPLNYPSDTDHPFYEYKMKHLLTAAALGMQPAKEWTGKYEANGGYLIVKANGDVLCYHFYDRNNFEDFLFSNTYLERASTTRHNYAYLYKDERGRTLFKLNLQIRLH